MERLLPRSRLLLPRDASLLLVEEKGERDCLTKAQLPVYKSDIPVKQQENNSAKEQAMDTVKEALHSTAEEYMCANPASGERMFVFRDPPESCDSVDVGKRKKKRNFLNLKKCSVAPTNLP